MLTREQYDFVAADNANERVAALFRLRNSTGSLIIQCLADREIQKAKYEQSGQTKSPDGETGGDPSRCYSYNSGVIHQPQLWSKVNKIIESIVSSE